MQAIGPANRAQYRKALLEALVGRPAWIGDGQAVATLKKTPGHNAHAYRIHMSAPGQNPAAGASRNADPNQKHSPHSPRQNSGDPEVGNEGNGGNEIPATDANSSDPKGKGATPGWSGRL